MKFEEIDASYLFNMKTYSRKEINNAGYIVNDTSKVQEEKEKALNIIEDFRLQHLFPTTSVRYFITRISKKYKKTLIMQRLKKMPTILDKISSNRKQYIKDLYDMQDIGGVRIVFNRVNEVLTFFNKLKEVENKNKNNFKIRKIKNYIENPKNTGYRGIHVVYNIKKSKKQENIDKMKVELQIRSKLQHIWATTLEIYDYWYGTSLKTQSKTQSGSEDWAEFFELVASLFAHLERQQLLPQHQDKGINYVMNKLKQEDKKIQQLKAIRIGTNKFNDIKNYKKNDILIIKKTKNKNPEILKFKNNQSEEAYKKYKQLEKDTLNDNFTEIIMFSINDGKKIIKSYPNFFNDTKAFIFIIEKQLSLYNKNNNLINKIKKLFVKLKKNSLLITHVYFNKIKP